MNNKSNNLADIHEKAILHESFHMFDHRGDADLAFYVFRNPFQMHIRLGVS